LKRVAALVAAAVTYLLAAWAVAPGFYDGFGPTQPYNWVCPPPQQAQYGNKPPLSGKLDIKVINGVSDANSAFTEDGQVVMGFLPGAFDATGKTVISVTIQPVTPCSNPPGLHFATNTYEITATAPLVKDANLLQRYSDLVPAPSTVYFATSPAGPWKSIGAAQNSQPFTIDTTTRQFGYFAAGYTAGSVVPKSSASQLIPLAVALLIVAVLVGGIPLAIVRRRQAAAVADPDDDGDEDA
jgi:hypothetical protein